MELVNRLYSMQQVSNPIIITFLQRLPLLQYKLISYLKMTFQNDLLWNYAIFVIAVPLYLTFILRCRRHSNIRAHFTKSVKFTLQTICALLMKIVQPIFTGLIAINVLFAMISPCTPYVCMYRTVGFRSLHLRIFTLSIMCIMSLQAIDDPATQFRPAYFFIISRHRYQCI